MRADVAGRPALPRPAGERRSRERAFDATETAGRLRRLAGRADDRPPDDATMVARLRAAVT